MSDEGTRHHYQQILPHADDLERYLQMVDLAIGDIARYHPESSHHDSAIASAQYHLARYELEMRRRSEAAMLQQSRRLQQATWALVFFTAALVLVTVADMVG